MSRRSRTEYAILGLLSLKPMSGYDMKAFISTSIGFFWQESYGQLYPTLRRLLDAELVSRQVEDGNGRPDRHLYSLTDAGREHLRDWMAADTEPERVRLELLLKLFFGPVTTPDIHRDQVEALLEQQLDRLRQFDVARDESLAEWEGTPYHPYFLSTLQYGVHVTRARVAWCRETLERLDAIDR